MVFLASGRCCPDNSIEALDYAIALGCYASECDVYLTKDERVIVAHADREDKINGFHPWETTYAEIAGKALLANDETIPALEDYLSHVLEAGTIKLWLDVKSISALPDSLADDYAARCAERVADIVRQKKAQHFVEVISARTEVHRRALRTARGEWPCGFMDVFL